MPSMGNGEYSAPPPNEFADVPPKRRSFLQNGPNRAGPGHAIHWTVEMFRKTLIAAGAALGLFHLWLLVSQFADGRLADPSALVRWALAVGLVWGLAVIRRQGSPMFWGRKAVSIWLLAALLHAPAVAERVGASGFDLPTVVVTLVEVTLGAGIAVASLIAFRRQRLLPPVAVAWAERPHSTLPLLASGDFLCLSPRPPPLS